MWLTVRTEKGESRLRLGHFEEPAALVRMSKGVGGDTALKCRLGEARTMKGMLGQTKRKRAPR